MIIFLVRHGSTADVGRVLSGRSDISLNEEGQGDASRLAGWFSRLQIERIESSPRVRAKETAETLARTQSMDVAVVDALDEVDFGCWTGRSFSSLADDPQWRQWNEQRATALTPGGETMDQATMRAVRHLETHTCTAPLVCVSHCDVIRGIVAHYLGLTLNRILAFDVGTTSVTTLERHDGETRLLALNERLS